VTYRRLKPRFAAGWHGFAMATSRCGLLPNPLMQPTNADGTRLLV
jgi:hypothetical protein